MVGNRLLTTATNVLLNCYLRDLMTSYKVMTRELLDPLDLRSDRFEIEAEITGKLLASGYRVYEVPISYRARTHQEGKKLHGTVAVSVLRELLKTRFGSWARSPSRRSGRAPGRTAGSSTVASVRLADEELKTVWDGKNHRSPPLG